MTHTPHPLDTTLYNVLATAARAIDGQSTFYPDSHLAPLALVNRMMERGAHSKGPDALTFPACTGGTDNIDLCYTLPNDLGQLRITDFCDHARMCRGFHVAWSAFATNGGSSAHTKLACLLWLDRFFQDILA